ncbi:MAG TPA: hypothetical protein VFF82_04645 [Rhodocyclaceae bacterium]|nr:hypothetical protein [Rhodocyclaceae bacterium]
MNREQWQQKRSHADITDAPPAFSTANFACLAHATEMPVGSDPVSADIRKQQFYDALGCCEWAIADLSPEDSPAGSH